MVLRSKRTLSSRRLPVGREGRRSGYAASHAAALTRLPGTCAVASLPLCALWYSVSGCSMRALMSCRRGCCGRWCESGDQTDVWSLSIGGCLCTGSRGPPGEVGGCSGFGASSASHGADVRAGCCPWLRPGLPGPFHPSVSWCSADFASWRPGAKKGT